ASLSQVDTGAASAVPATARGAPTAIAPTTASRASFRPRRESGREVIFDLLLIAPTSERARQRRPEGSGQCAFSDHEWRGGRPSCAPRSPQSRHLLDGPEPRDWVWARRFRMHFSIEPSGSTAR